MHPRPPVALIIVMLLASISSASVAYQEVETDMLFLEVSTDGSAYLPDGIVHVTYYVYLPNGRVVGYGEGAWFLNDTETGANIVNGTLVSSHGTFAIDLGDYNMTPAGSKARYVLTIVYRAGNATVEDSTGIIVINPEFFSYDFFTAPLSGGYYPGYYFQIIIRSPVGNIDVDYVNIRHGNTTIENLTGLKVDGHGILKRNVLIPTDIPPGSVVNLTASILGVVRDFYFTVQKDYGLNLMLDDHGGVLSGDTVTMAVTNTSGIDDPYYHFYVTDQYGRVLYRYYTTQNLTTFRVPDNYTGYLMFRVEVFNGTGKVGELNKYREVKAASLEVYFDRMNYNPGDEFHAFLDFRSNVMKNPSFIYEVYASYDGMFYDLQERVKTAGRVLNITVPENPPLSYRVTVTAVDGSNAVKAQAFIYLSTPAFVEARVITRSPYATGVFTPGETVEIEYNVSGDFRNGVLYYGFENQFYRDPKALRVEPGSSGHIAVSIPEGLGKGTYVFHLKLVYEGGEVEKDVLIDVDDNPPWSQYLILTIPAGDFFAILVIVAIVVFGALMIKYPPRGKRGANGQGGEAPRIKEEILEEESE